MLIVNLVKNFLESNGYKVRAEVKNCDIAATKGDELIIVELKLKVNLQLLMQAADRQRITDSVYVAIVKPKNTSNKHWKKIRNLLRRLEIGLNFVDPNNPENPVEIVFHPLRFQKKKLKRRKRAIIKEMENRSQNLNIGGSNRKKIITSYRESAIQIAVYLNLAGANSSKNLRKLGTGEKTHSILYSNFYGWFQRIERGIYELSPKGKNELNNFPKLTKKYENLYNQNITSLKK